MVLVLECLLPLAMHLEMVVLQLLVMVLLLVPLILLLAPVPTPMTDLFLLHPSNLSLSTLVATPMDPSS